MVCIISFYILTSSGRMFYRKEEHLTQNRLVNTLQIEIFTEKNDNKRCLVEPYTGQEFDNNLVNFIRIQFNRMTN